MVDEVHYLEDCDPDCDGRGKTRDLFRPEVRKLGEALSLIRSDLCPIICLSANMTPTIYKLVRHASAPLLHSRYLLSRHDIN